MRRKSYHKGGAAITKAYTKQLNFNLLTVHQDRSRSPVNLRSLSRTKGQGDVNIIKVLAQLPDTVTNYGFATLEIEFFLETFEDSMCGMSLFTGRCLIFFKSLVDKFQNFRGYDRRFPFKRV